jgi:type IX secretion system PorP/SprF family membrane protein
MKKILYTALFSALASGAAFGQQDIQFSQALSNPYLFNPGASGMSDVGEINLGTRAQWLSVEGSPVTYYATVQSQVRFKKGKAAVLEEFAEDRKSVYETPARTIGTKHILGGKALSDNIGPFARMSAMGSYAYHLPLTSKINIGLGIGLGYTSFSIDESRVRLGESNDGAYLSYLGSTNRAGMIDVQTGLVVYNNRFYVGISGSQMMKGTAKFNGIESESTFERHLYAVGSYRFDLGTSYGLEPVVILKSTKASPLSMDAGFRLHYRRMGWVSLAYRSTTALSAGFGINLFKQFRVAYAYDMGIAGLRSYGQGAHEIQLGFVFGHRRNIAREFREQEKQKIEESDELKPGTE